MFRKCNSLVYPRSKIKSEENEDLLFSLLTVFSTFSDRFPCNNLSIKC